jgi:hypothetical protein
MVMTQTTNSIFNSSLWDLVQPKSLLGKWRVYVCMYVCMCVFIVSYTLITCAVSLIHQVLAFVPFTWLL